MPLGCCVIPESTKKDFAAEEYFRDLERLGIIHRVQFNEIPPHVEYSLTEKGRALLPFFTELAKWGEKYIEPEDQRVEGSPEARQKEDCTL